MTEELIKMADKEGWRCIFTPPYSPKLQPIELFWAHAKNYVGANYPAFDN